MLKISPVSFGNLYKPAFTTNNTSFTSRLNSNKDKYNRNGIHTQSLSNTGL